MREELDAFNPDIVLVWGDDQYENFREDVIPAFCRARLRRVRGQALGAPPRPQLLGRAAETTFIYKGHQRAGKYLATQLLEAASTSRTPTSRTTSTAWRTPSSTRRCTWTGTARASLPASCPSRSTATAGLRDAVRGAVLNNLADVPDEDELDPPSPAPYRCFDIGARDRAGDRRQPLAGGAGGLVELVARLPHGALLSTSTRTWRTDKRYYEAMKDGDYKLWRETPCREWKQPATTSC